MGEIKQRLQEQQRIEENGEDIPDENKRRNVPFLPRSWTQLDIQPNLRDVLSQGTFIASTILFPHSLSLLSLSSLSFSPSLSLPFLYHLFSLSLSSLFPIFSSLASFSPSLLSTPSPSLLSPLFLLSLFSLSSSHSLCFSLPLYPLTFFLLSLFLPTSLSHKNVWN
ncbi:unnamed protein product [Acanthosepion pharaonis]|uniref:Uncharacterized protein n=1 Tax=Acanthosepion pharaonis TaxID=158019 RepID=A0A812B2C9_ACAPH|nr:unnamed protein product [Sepia pharaonis]